MASELKHQSDIIKSVKRDGGHAIKMSNRFLIGVPDLLIALPPFAPLVMEVKDLGAVVDKFDRQLDVTPKQGEFMENFSDPYTRTAGAATALIGVHIIHKGEHRLVVLPHQARRITWEYELHPAMWAKRETGLYYNLRPMFEGWSVARVKQR